MAAFLFLASLLGQAAGVSIVLDLKSSDFNKHILENKQTLVQFHAPWCGHCKKLAPEYEKAAQQLMDSKGIPMAKIDATEHKDIATKYNVKGFPTLIWFEDGKEMEYDGGRTSETIVEWVVSMIGAAVTETASPPQPDGLKPIVTLTGPSLVPAFESAAKANRRKAAWYFVKGSSNTISLQHSEEAAIDYKGSTSDKDAIGAFLTENILPMFGVLDGDTWDKYMATGKGLIWALFSEPDLATVRKNHGAMMTEVAKANRGKYFVAYVDVKKFAEPIDNMLGIKDFPAVAVQKKAGDKYKYIHTGSMTSSDIMTFVASVDSGAAKPKLKSEPEPPNKNEIVRQVVSTTMEQEIFMDTKDVLLFVHAPWCGHCKKLDPEYTKLAEKIKQDGHDAYFKLAKMDGTANDSPVDAMEWTGFPTLYFIKQGSRDATVYEGERSAKGLWKFLKKSATKADEIKHKIEQRQAAQKRASEL